MTKVVCGENVKVKLKGVEENDISSGFVLCDPNNPIKSCKTFDAQVRILYLLLLRLALRFHAKVSLLNRDIHTCEIRTLPL